MAILLLAALATAPLAAPDLQPICRSQVEKADADALTAPDVRAKAKKLGELPPAAHVLTVLHQEGGCTVPQVVRYGIGR